MLSPLAGAMNRQTSSRPSGVSQPCRRPRCTAKQSAVSSSGPRNWWPHSWAWIHILTGVETLVSSLGLRMRKPGIGGAVVVEIVVEHRRAAGRTPACARRASAARPARSWHRRRRGPRTLPAWARPARAPSSQCSRNRASAPAPPTEAVPRKSCAPQVRNALVIRPCLDRHLGAFTAGNATCELRRACALRRAGVTSQSPAEAFDVLHVGVRQSEMMADLVHQHVGDEMAQRLARPRPSSRAAARRYRNTMSGPRGRSMTLFLSRLTPW